MRGVLLEIYVTAWDHHKLMNCITKGPQPLDRWAKEIRELSRLGRNRVWNTHGHVLHKARFISENKVISKCTFLAWPSEGSPKVICWHREPWRETETQSPIHACLACNNMRVTTSSGLRFLTHKWFLSSLPSLSLHLSISIMLLVYTEDQWRYGQRINPDTFTSFPLQEHDVNSKGQKPKCLGSVWHLRRKTLANWIQPLSPEDEKRGTKHEEISLKGKLKQKQQPQKEYMLIKHWFGSNVYICIILSAFYRCRNSCWEKPQSPDTSPSDVGFMRVGSLLLLLLF